MDATVKKYGLNDQERQEWYYNVVKPFFLDGKQKELQTGQQNSCKKNS